VGHSKQSFEVRHCENAAGGKTRAFTRKREFTFSTCLRFQFKGIVSADKRPRSIYDTSVTLKKNTFAVFAFSHFIDIGFTPFYLTGKGIDRF
jgi:hypothetical protein